jgi:hypothetical protein
VRKERGELAWLRRRLPRERSPTTTGKIERLHRSLQNELLAEHGRFESFGGARPAWPPPLPAGTGTAIETERMVNAAGPVSKIHAGMIHAGKTATVICENNHFQVIIGGETAVVVPRTATISQQSRIRADPGV